MKFSTSDSFPLIMSHISVPKKNNTNKTPGIEPESNRANQDFLVLVYHTFVIVYFLGHCFDILWYCNFVLLIQITALIWIDVYMCTWPNTTKGASCILLKKLRFMHYLTDINKLSNDTKFINIEVTLLNIQVLQNVNFL